MGKDENENMGFIYLQQRRLSEIRLCAYTMRPARLLGEKGGRRGPTTPRHRGGRGAASLLLWGEAGQPTTAQRSRLGSSKSASVRAVGQCCLFGALRKAQEGFVTLRGSCKGWLCHR